MPIGLEKMYQKNPHDKAARAAGSMMPSSGLAAPGLAYMMGRESGRAKAWDDDQAMQMAAGQTLTMAMKMSENDPEMANQIMEVEGQKNPYVKDMWDNNFRFNAKGSPGVKYFQLGSTLYALNEQALGADMAAAKRAAGDAEMDKETFAELLEKHSHKIADAGGSKKGKDVKIRDVIMGEGKQTMALDPETGKVIRKLGKPGTGKPPTGGAGGEKLSSILKNIRDTARQIASKIGGADMMEIVASIQDPETLNDFLKEVKKRKGEEDPFVQDMIQTLEGFKEQFKTSTGKDFDPSPGLAAVNPAASKGALGKPNDAAMEKAIMAANIRDLKGARDFLIKTYGMTEAEATAAVKRMN